MARPLEGLKVLDFSTLLPGPMATLFLAEAGAEVIKVERPGKGEEMRSYSPRFGEDSVNFVLLNRGKQSVAVDLKSPAGLEQVRALIAQSDVLVEQFRPGVMEKLGLGHAAAAAINPRLIYCSITGYGQTGPKSLTAGHDLNYIGDVGLLALSYGSAAQPVLPPALIADIGGGTYPAVINILLALAQRQRTGLGCHIDIAMADNLFAFMYWALGNGLATDAWPGNGTDLVTGGTARYQLYPTSDGKIVAAAPLEDKFWAAFCDAIGLPAALRDDAADPAATIAGVAAILSGRSAEHWRPLFAAADCCCSIVADVQEAVADAHFHSRGLFAHRVANGSGDTLPALPVPIAPQFRASPDHAIASPALGEYDAILNAAAAG